MRSVYRAVPGAEIDRDFPGGMGIKAKGAYFRQADLRLCGAGGADKGDCRQRGDRGGTGGIVYRYLRSLQRAASEGVSSGDKDLGGSRLLRGCHAGETRGGPGDDEVLPGSFDRDREIRRRRLKSLVRQFHSLYNEVNRGKETTDIMTNEECKAKAQALLADMSVDEKVAQIGGIMYIEGMYDRILPLLEKKGKTK